MSIQQAKQYRAQIKVNYSDDAGTSLERTFTISEAQSYQEFMKLISDAYELIRFTFGQDEFDKLEKKAREPEQAQEEDTPSDPVEETEKEND